MENRIYIKIYLEKNNIYNQIDLLLENINFQIAGNTLFPHVIQRRESHHFNPALLKGIKTHFLVQLLTRHPGCLLTE